MSVSEREQTKFVHRERRMAIMIAAEAASSTEGANHEIISVSEREQTNQETDLPDIDIRRNRKMMRNKEVLNEIRKQSRTRIEEKRDKFVRQSLLSDEFIDMMQRNRKPFELLMSYYQCAIMEIETKFKVLNEEYSLEYDKNPIEGIKSRIKSYDSLLKKIRRKDIPMTLESIEKNITDIAGVRVICSFPADIYEVADSFLRQDDITLLERKDYIQNPKPSGYRSLHLIVQVPIFLQNEKKAVTVEVQFRTIAMDFWASLEHKMRYKKNIPAEQMKYLQDELYDCAEQSAALDKRMQSIRNLIAENKEEEKPKEFFLPFF